MSIVIGADAAGLRLIKSKEWLLQKFQMNVQLI